LKTRTANDSRKDKVAYLRSVKKKGCVICGYKICLNALVFHHIDPSTKYKRENWTKRSMNTLCNSSWKKLSVEIAKCIVVCSNCHAEIHMGLHPEYLMDVLVDIDDGLPVQMAFTEFIE
jgi:hypothetical protein